MHFRNQLTNFLHFISPQAATLFFFWTVLRPWVRVTYSFNWLTNGDLLGFRISNLTIWVVEFVATECSDVVQLAGNNYTWINLGKCQEKSTVIISQNQASKVSEGWLDMLTLIGCLDHQFCWHITHLIILVLLKKISLCPAISFSSSFYYVYVQL